MTVRFRPIADVQIAIKFTKRMAAFDARPSYFLGGCAAMFSERLEHFRVRAKGIVAFYLSFQPSLTPVLGCTTSAASPCLLHYGFDIAYGDKRGVETDGLEHRSHSPLRVRMQIFPVTKRQYASYTDHRHGGDNLYR